MEAIGKILRNARDEAGLTQGQVAKRAGFKSPQYISNIERGLCRPSLDFLRLALKLYQLDKKYVVDALVKQHRSDVERVLR